MADTPPGWRNIKWHSEQRRVAMWDITYHCNLACNHCYNEEYRGNHADEFLPQGRSVEVVDGLAEDGFDEVNLLGGEPLSVPHVPRILQRGRKVGINVSITTNGLLLKEQLAERFADLGFSRIAFSLAGLHEDTNAAVRGRGVLERVLRNVRSFADLLARRGVPNETSINLSMTSLNQDELSGLYAFCCEWGLSAASVHLTQPMGAAGDRLDLIEADPRGVMDAYEAAIQTWGPGVALTLDTRPPAAHFLAYKFGLRQPLFRADCPGGDQTVCVQPDGSRAACRLQTMRKARLATPRTDPCDGSLSSFVRWKSGVQKPMFCEGCRFIDVCAPCPLVARDERPPECTVASERSEAYTGVLLDEPLHKVEAVAIVQSDDGRPALALEGKRQRLSESGLRTWRAIDEGITPRQLVAQLLPGESNGTHVRDMIEFVQALRRAGLVRLSGDKQAQLPIRCVLVCCAR